MSETVAEILRQAGVDDPYQEIDYADLPEDLQKEVDALELTEALKAEVANAGRHDFILINKLLLAMATFQSIDALGFVINALDEVYPSLPQAVVYLRSVARASTDLREYGDQLLDYLDSSILAHLPAHQMWILSLFANSPAWGCADRLPSTYDALVSEVARREIVLARALAKDDVWFRRTKHEWAGMNPWLRRAYLAGAHCMPGDEAGFWYDSIIRQTDSLEEAIVKRVRSLHGV